MSDEKIVRTWGYKGTQSKIFDLKEGESLPSGWSDSPATAAEEKPKRKPKAKVEEVAEESEAEEDLTEEDEDDEDSQ